MCVVPSSRGVYTISNTSLQRCIGLRARSARIINSSAAATNATGSRTPIPFITRWSLLRFSDSEDASFSSTGAGCPTPLPRTRRLLKTVFVLDLFCAFMLFSSAKPFIGVKWKARCDTSFEDATRCCNARAYRLLFGFFPAALLREHSNNTNVPLLILTKESNVDGSLPASYQVVRGFSQSIWVQMISLDYVFPDENFDGVFLLNSVDIKLDIIMQ
mmetsp:Transcript_30923/g.45751  ORF Transcript_30923/g.45751 Transcript_30923/m.45751 type:complete len:216 (+) Transcript_30923:201-848(+)